MNFYDPVWKEDCPLDGLHNPYWRLDWYNPGFNYLDWLTNTWRCDTYGACRMQAINCYSGREPGNGFDPTPLPPAPPEHARIRLLT